MVNRSQSRQKIVDRVYTNPHAKPSHDGQTMHKKREFKDLFVWQRVLAKEWSHRVPSFLPTSTNKSRFTNRKFARTVK